MAPESGRYGCIKGEQMSYVLTGIGLLAAIIYVILEYRKANHDNDNQ